VPPLIVLYVIALFSIPTLYKRLPPLLWKVLRTGGLSYIAYAFAADFLNEPFNHNPKHVVLYAPFALLTVAGPLLHFLWLVSPGKRQPKAA
jgi:hypothetical protein